VVSRLITERGGHNAGVWREAEPAAFDWLTKQFGTGQKVVAPPGNSANKVASGTFTHG
jgi:hypothetical protein